MNKRGEAKPWKNITIRAVLRDKKFEDIQRIGMGII